MKIEEIKKYIKAHKLDTPIRYREFNDIRGVLYSYLREKGFKFQEIGKLFNRDHATVINGIKRYNDLHTFKDHKENTKHVRAFLKYQTDLKQLDWKDELLKCETLIEFHRLQKQVKEELI